MNNNITEPVLIPNLTELQLPEEQHTAVIAHTLIAIGGYMICPHCDRLTTNTDVPTTAAAYLQAIEALHMPRSRKQTRNLRRTNQTLGALEVIQPALAGSV